MKTELQVLSMKYARLHSAALQLYQSAIWITANLSSAEAVVLWENLRDALGLPQGTATSLGVASDSNKHL